MVVSLVAGWGVCYWDDFTGGNSQKKGISGITTGGS